MKELIEKIILHWNEVTIVTVSVYEFMVRLIPTVKNYSIISKVVDLISFIDKFLNNKKR